jgi:hypothetical protein
VKSPIAPLLALSLVLASGACRATSGGSTPAAVAFASLAEGTGAGQAEQPRVIRTASGLERLWVQLGAPGAAPSVDFAREMVVYAPGGSVARVVVQGGFLRVECARAPGAWQLVRVPQSEAPVQFEAAG